MADTWYNRFLCPQKIWLLALALVFSKGVVPPSSVVQVLDFIMNNITNDAETTCNSWVSGIDPVILTEHFRSLLSTMDSTISGRTIWHLLLKKIWKIQSPNGLNEMISHAPTVLIPGRQMVPQGGYDHLETRYRLISRESLIGAFIRRTHLEYTRLHITHADALWRSFLAFREPTHQAFREMIQLYHPPPGPSIGPSTGSPTGPISYYYNLPGLPNQHGNFPDEFSFDRWWTSTHDVEALIAYQFSELQRFGRRLPDEMRATLRRHAYLATSTPAFGHYLLFLDAWRAGNFPAAYDNLHRYFDYAINAVENTFCQYALLNMAILQADFGCPGEAAPALLEAIASARENNDSHCLNFCQSWLHHFRCAFKAEMEQLGTETGMVGEVSEALSTLRMRAKDEEMWSLLSSALLSEARLNLERGGSIAAAFEALTKARHLDVQRELTSQEAPRVMLRSALYERIGLSYMAWSGSDILRECYAADTSIDDAVRARVRMAYYLARRGRYDQAEEVLAELCRSRMLKPEYEREWTFSVGVTKLQRMLRNDNLDLAQRIYEKLRALEPPHRDDCIALGVLEIDLFVRQHSYDKALRIVETLARRSDPENRDVMYHIQLLNLKARILMKAGRPYEGISITAHAASRAYRARLLPCLFDACVTLADILMRMHDLRGAARLLEAIVPQTLACLDTDLAARTYCSLADAHMGLAGVEAEASAKRVARLEQAYEYLVPALTEYKKLEDLNGQLEILSKKSMVMHLRGDFELANGTAAEYATTRNRYKTPN